MAAIGVRVGQDLIGDSAPGPSAFIAAAQP
jgi:hypothetical protein